MSPSTTTISSGAQQQFVATLTGTSNTAVVWKASAGAISNSGLFTAPSVTSDTKVTITATNVVNVPTPNPPIADAIGRFPVGGGSGILPVVSSISSTAEVAVVPKATLAISNSLLASGAAGVPYSATLTAVGGGSSYQWRITGGALPQGLSLNLSTGVISGIPIQTGTYSFTASVSDGGSTSASKSLDLTIDASTAGNFDGPAELPRVYIQSSLADTPATGTVTLVPSGGDLQAALNDASCGDTIQLQAGATFTGIFTFPAKSCSDSNWIIVRTSAADSALPPEGTRLTPCYAGVSSLPGRPPFQCAATANVTAKLVMNASEGSGPILFASGANHYRLIGLEVTRQQGTPVVYSLASIQSTTGTMDHIVFDRVWMHGTAHDETNRGIELGGSTYVSVVDSFFTDFHCISITGSCGDAQAIYGGIGSNPMGPYQFVDNFLEASGENILFGGGTATLTPADIQISRNHMFKPLTWMKGQPGYVGGTNGNPFIVKNLFELKNAQRVLLDSNIMEDSWGGFSQSGFGILLTPRNQSNGNGPNLCPNCQVTDVTIRYGTISHVGAGLQIANPVDGNGVPLAGERYSIHDLIIDDIDGVKYNGPSEFAEVSVGAGAPTLESLTINHVTAFPSSMQFMVGDQTAAAKMANFVFTNSIVNAGTYPVWSTGSGGSANCAAHDSPLITFNACFSPYTFAKNAIIAPPKSFPASVWPAGNFFPASAATVQFVNYNGGNGGDYHLLPSSPYIGAASDGTNLGANVDAVMADIAGVE
ncbi:MAG TPA: Ig domain-containing protein [Terriglobales bacterium]|nr:Ig domain-containing protein [Terriglobales bacterium]